MPFYYSEEPLREVSRPPGRPGHGLPDPERPVDPGYGIEDGGPPGIWPGFPAHPLPEPPPGVWPPPSLGHPGQPLPPTDPTPPGTIWPSPGKPEHPIASQKFWIVAGIPGVGWRYVCVDPSLLPRPMPHA